MRLGILACFAVFTCAAANDVRLIDAIKRRDIKAFDTLMAQHPDVNAAFPMGPRRFRGQCSSICGSRPRS